MTVRMMLVSLASLALAAGPVAAQQTPRPVDPATGASGVVAPDAPAYAYYFESADRPRLGVFLRPGCEVSPDAAGTCPAPPVVASVVEGAPAAKAGLLPGDTLLSLDGTSLRSADGRRAMAGLRAGTPVVLEVAKDGERRSVRLTPVVSRPSGIFRMNGTAWRSAAPAPGETSDVAVVRFRDESGGISQLQVAPGPRPAGRSAESFVVFRTDDSGTLTVELGEPDVEVRTPDGELVRLLELEARIHELRDRMADESGDDVDVEDVDLRLVSEDHRLILENAALARRLQAVRNEVLSDARVHLDSVVRVRARFAERGESPAAVALGDRFDYTVRPVAPGANAWVSRSDDSALRLAGAEFRELTPELAEYFPVDAGLLVLRVIPQTPADRLGLRGGDVVIEVGDVTTPDMITFRRLVVESETSGRPLTVKWNRKGSMHDGALNR